MPLDYWDLARTCLPPRRGADVRIARSAPGPMTPIDEDNELVRSAIVWELGVWEIPVREAAGLPPTPEIVPARPGWLVSARVKFLHTRIRILAGLPAHYSYADGPDQPPLELSGLQGLQRLRGLHRRARAILGLTRRVVHVPGDCSGCGQWQLRRAEGGDRVWCQICGRTWTQVAYERYVTATTVELLAAGEGVNE